MMGWILPPEIGQIYMRMRYLHCSTVKKILNNAYFYLTPEILDKDSCTYYSQTFVSCRFQNYQEAVLRREKISQQHTRPC